MSSEYRRGDRRPSPGYIPPPEQHLLGGSNTWEARSAGLKVTAEPKTTDAALRALDQVSDRRRRVYQQSRGPVAEAIVELEPLAWWRLGEWSGTHASDSADDHDGLYEPDVAFFFHGPEGFCKGHEQNRSAHFAGGRLPTRLKKLDANAWSVSLWVWNGMPTDGRDVTGWMFSRGDDVGLCAASDHVGLGNGTGRESTTTSATWTGHSGRDQPSLRVRVRTGGQSQYRLPGELRPPRRIVDRDRS